MERRTTDYIRRLTAADRKTLAQKAVKAMEEAGELARVALPFENAHGTAHRFIDRSRLLEEVCDVVLTTVSVAYDLGFPDEAVDASLAAGWLKLNEPAPLAELVLAVGIGVGRTCEAALALSAARRRGDSGREPAWKAALEAVGEAMAAALAIARRLGFDDDDTEAMLGRKTLKWADLQARDPGDPLPYEIHVTVARIDDATFNDADFRAACRELAVKPIVLDLGSAPRDVMTSSTFYGDNPGALVEMRRVSAGLRQAGFTVLREKIETVSWHPAAPSASHLVPVMPPGCYFECHLNVVASDDRRELLELLSKANGAHLSRNVFKRLDASTFTVMVTLRRADAIVAEAFRAEVAHLRGLLEAARFDVEKEIIEFSIYDTRVTHDDVWLTQGAAHVA